MADRSSVEYVARPFADLPGEPGWVAMREIVPIATANARTLPAYGGKDVHVVTVLPGDTVAQHRANGDIYLGLQSTVPSDDISRDLAAALLRAVDAEPNTGIGYQRATADSPRLQDVLDLSVPFEPVVRSDYEYWLDDDAERTPEVKQALNEAVEATVPMAAVPGVDHAYWADMHNQFVRWVRPEDEDDVVKALARLQARRATAIPMGDGGEARFLGMFRAAGLTIPVWQLPAGTTAEDAAEPLTRFGETFDAALAETAPLDANERRAKAGIVSRQVTLR